MKIFKTKIFSRWANKEGLKDETLITAIREIENGLVDVDYGNHVFKKRIGLNNQGKRGSVRTIIGFKSGDKAFFLYAFKKGAKENISDKEKNILKEVSRDFFSLTEKQLKVAITSGKLIKIEVDNDG